ncbi:MAG TPA: indole-3-glycerol phosphate synthase TrpC [Patescibacteria group bacterium]|nr:indole-3-glycerol phosphate synthase TrpC [Patescibacteria group bacterium]
MRSATMLSQILAHKREEVAERQMSAPLAELRAKAFDSPPPRDFTTAVTRRRREKETREPLRAIAEIKRASPSAGIIREPLDVAEIAASYQAAGASAISVLTDSRFFKGSLEDIATARAAVDLPVLRKEFIITPYQIYESRAHRVDAILLIAAALEASELQDLYALAKSLSLHPLVEIHTLEELESAKAVGATLIGINNRDLATLETRLETTFALLPHLPREAVVVSESGIRRPEDIRRVSEAGVDAVLVGEALLTSRDPGGRLRELLAGAHY